ncbi:MAG: hypothetical protein ACP5OZ_01840 [Candidatus Woesearchaeota archaeon]
MNKKRTFRLILFMLFVGIIFSCTFLVNKKNNKIVDLNQSISKNSNLKNILTKNDENSNNNNLIREINSENYSQSLQQPLSLNSSAEIIDELISIIIKYVNSSLLDNCSIIGSFEFNKTSQKYEPLKYGVGYFLVYDFSEIYKKTKEDYYLKIAEEQKRCIEEKFWPENPDNERLFILSTIVWAESSYYLALKEKPDEELISLADYILKKESSKQSFHTYSQEMIRTVLALSNYYALTGKEEFYQKSKQMMIDLEQKRSANKDFHEYVKAEFLRGWCEIYKTKKEKEIIPYINKNFDVIVSFRNDDGSFSIKEIEKTLITYQVLGALDSCYEATNDEKYTKLIIGTFNFLLKNADKEQGGIIELENKKSISLNTEILKVLVKLKSKIKN